MNTLKRMPSTYIYFEYIELFVHILDYYKRPNMEASDIYNHKVIRKYSDFFIRLFNGMDRNEAMQLLDINLNGSIKLISVDYSTNDNNVKWVFRYKINNHLVSKHIELIKSIPRQTYYKIVRQNKDKSNEFFLLYVMCGFDSGHFWGLHPNIYKEILKYDPDTIECFASPFNHTLDNFYSLFSKIDTFYGSKGSFFDDFLTATNKSYVVNPPFEEFIMHKVFDLIHLKLSKPEPCIIFLYLPQWDDLMDGHLNTITANPKINVRKCSLNKNESIVYDYIKMKSINASFPTYFMYFDNHDCDYCENYKRLCNMQKK